MEKKSQLGNVAFGGNWSEEILFTEELISVLDIIDRAVTDCCDRDVRDAAFETAMLYVRQNVEKGPMLCRAMSEALGQENQILRQKDALIVAARIREWAGL